MVPKPLCLLGSLLLAAVLCASDQDAENSTCLPGGIPFASRQFLVQLGEEVPLGFMALDWASPYIATDIAKILAEEVLGLHTATIGTASATVTGLFKLAGCTNAELYADLELAGCNIESHAKSPYHVGLELWGIQRAAEMEQRLAGVPTIIPSNAGSIGYEGREGMYIFETERYTAYEQSGLAVDYYRDWNVSWNEPWHFFDKMVDVDPSRLLPCEETSIGIDVEGFKQHVLFTGDEDGVVRDANGNIVSGRCWNSSWWVSPACRQDLSRCVPSLTSGGLASWGFKSFMQQSTFHNMPIAIAVVKDWSAYVALGGSIRGPHFWWTPDSTFAAKKPSRVVFPEYNDDDFRKGKLDATAPTTRLQKFLWNRLSDVSPTAFSFINNLEIGNEHMNNMLVDLETTPGATYKEVACRWIRANEASWRNWIPDERHCQPGAGIVDANGNFVTSISDATRCEFCPPGRHGTSKTPENTRMCVACAPGTSQELPAQTECVNCVAGFAAAEPGQSSCSICLEGLFQNETGGIECHSCPTGTTTRLLGATSFNECICPQDMYEAYVEGARGGGVVPCRACPEGMSCEIDSREQWLLELQPGRDTADRPIRISYPIVRKGYMTRLEEPLKVYKCMTEETCPGGSPGSCAIRRDAGAIACGECETDAYEDVSKKCKKCNTFQVIVMISLAPILVVAGLVVLAWASNKERITEINASATCAIITGLTCASIQTMSVLNNLEVDWAEPLDSVLSAMMLLGFDVRVINVGCLLEGGVGMFLLRQLFAPGCAVVLVIISALWKRFHCPSLDISVHATNSVGSLFLLFYTAMMLSAVMPLICYKHPDGNGESMVSEPSILCFDSDKHSVMMAVGCGGLFGVCVPFFCLVVCITLLYPRIVVSGRSIHLRRIFFLVRRFKPEAYYYGAMLLTRSLLLCIVPIAFRDKAAAQVLLFSALLTVFVFLQSMIYPWRGVIANMLDTCISLAMILILMCGALSTNPPDAQDTVSVFGNVAVAFLLVAIVGSMCLGLYLRFIPRPFYSYFVCHHKAGAAAQARLLQQLIQRKSQRLCFLDSDNLTNLDELFDIVRSKVGRLVVYLSRDVLTRPWCVGEVTTAYKTNLSTTRVMTEFFKPPSEQLDSELTEAMGPEFLEAGINLPDVQAALQWLMSSSVSEAKANEALLGTKKINQVADDIIQKNSGATISSQATMDSRESRFADGSILISSHVNDEEATACSGILAMLMQDFAMAHTGHGLAPMSNMSTVASGDLDYKGIRGLMANGCATIVVLTEGSLTSVVQLNTMFAAVDLATSGDHEIALPVNTGNFRFPDETFYNVTLAQVLDSSLKHEKAIEMLQQLFRKISVRFTPSASRTILETEANQVEKRLVLEWGRRQQVSSQNHQTSTQSRSVPLRSSNPRETESKSLNLEKNKWSKEDQQDDIIVEKAVDNAEIDGTKHEVENNDQKFELEC